MAPQLKPVWEPRETQNTNVAKFMKYVNEKYNTNLRTYEDLHSWSIHPSTFQDFWADAYEWLGLAPEGQRKRGPVLSTKDAAQSRMFPPPKFFPEESLNIAEIILRGRKDQDMAIYFAREGVTGVENVTWASLKERVRAVRSALINSGVQPGDVIAAIVSNSVTTMAIALATLSIGAVWSSSSCDLGVPGIVDRYKQIHPKIIFADSGYVYAGKRIDLGSRIEEWSHALTDEPGSKLSKVVVISNIGIECRITSIAKGESFTTFTGRASRELLTFSLVPFNHPGFILFSSGTTGPPKCIVHSVGGVALKVKVDMSLQHDVRRSDVVFQYTTASWVMWVLNLLNLSCAASMLLYDGSPFHPRPTILLELAEETGVAIFGTSPRYLASLNSYGIIPRKQFNLDRLRVVTSTGSVLSADQCNWFYKEGFAPSIHLASMSGGTDIAGCFVGGTPILSMFAGEIQCKALGMAVDIYDSSSEESKSIEASGLAGELVCTKPFPSQPLAFVGQNGMAKYKSSYFDRFGTQAWCQGDYIQRLTHSGGLVILGRSDGVLNPSGVRFGSAEIYAITDTFPEIADSLCVGQKRETYEDERVLLFVKMHPQQHLTPPLEKRIRDAIRAAYSPRHVPRYIFEIPDIPYTVNGKKCEINVKNIVCNRKTAVSGTVANPDALRAYEKYQSLPTDSRAAQQARL